MTDKIQPIDTKLFEPAIQPVLRVEPRNHDEEQQERDELRREREIKRRDKERADAEAEALRLANEEDDEGYHHVDVRA